MEQLTPAEVAHVLDTPLKSITKVLDEGPVRARTVQRAKRRLRMIDEIDLLYLVAIRDLRGQLTPKGRAAFYEALRRWRPGWPKRVEFGHLSVDLTAAVAEVERRLKRLHKPAASIAIDENGEAVITGTNVEAHRIAALLDGDLTVEQVLQDYPNLNRAQVEAAKAYADAHPKPGRPYPPTTFTRALASAGPWLREALNEVAHRKKR